MEKIGQVFGLEEAARRMSLSVWTLRKWVAEKRLAHVKLGRRLAIPESEIERVLREGFRGAK